jgi:hypothetical protein
MKRVTILSVVCFVCLFGEAALAQSTACPTIEGVMIRKFVKKQHPGTVERTGVSTREITDRINVFSSPDVYYDKETQQWRIITDAAASTWTGGKTVDMWIKYNEQSGVLIISLVEERRNQWTLKRDPNIKVTIAEDKSSFRLEFLQDFEGTNKEGYNYNWMTGSRLRVTR